ncbi:MAG: SDR family NAD(P)-dependent oxidoreductase [Wenzhouxiangella sp.]|jgi:NAD(P)-dependent dehydrogenase (short-subunit alcohol dehydrogenase family)|nr:SDR family NAD(P)-dependent oxidoreductase [Wenzhouxiangella sp.]
MQLSDQTVFVTGAASGIGAAVAERCLAEGAHVGLVDRDAKGLESLVGGLSAELRARTCSYAINVASESDVEEAIDDLVAKRSSIDAAVNCAGILGPVGPLHETSTEAYRELMSVNLDGMFFSMKHQLRAMTKSGKGSIVNISSAAGIVGFPTAAAYTAAKHGVIGLTKTCAIDYAESGIRVNAIAPGGVDTPLIRATTCSTPEGKQMIESLHPMKRLASAEEIANAALFLISDQASFVTGSVMAVDGGWTTW